DASSAIVHVSDCVDTVQKTLASTGNDKLVQMIRITWDNVCASCELKESCRDEIKNPKNETIEKIADALRNHAVLDETKFPKKFSVSCYSFNEMCSSLQKKYINYLASLSADGKLTQMQGLLSDQFKSMADILKEIACDFNEEINVNPEMADICLNEAQESGLSVLSADSVVDKFDRYTISLEVISPRDDFNISRFTENLSLATGIKLNLPEIAEGDCTCIMKFSQKLLYSVDVGAFSRSMDDVQVCGDYYQSFRDENSRIISVLSDGMGTGSRAAVDSAMAAELFSKLVKSGLSFDCALPIANSALLVKSSDESLATLDVVCIDLYSGRTDFMKAGAAATFIRHREKVAALEQASLPIGILRDVSFSKAVARLSAGDIVLMVSDGVLGNCNGWIQQELKLWDRSRHPRELAEFIVNSACERKMGGHRDDMTAIVIYIKTAND
ncbi:MAG: SpoIIE family protein phosphatase, partial [Ruminococcus sp.]|nr:SpoIIE family protein phosphatase [Candidatus Copronaster equi]